MHWLLTSVSVCSFLGLQWHDSQKMVRSLNHSYLCDLGMGNYRVLNMYSVLAFPILYIWGPRIEWPGLLGRIQDLDWKLQDRKTEATIIPFFALSPQDCCFLLSLFPSGLSLYSIKKCLFVPLIEELGSSNMGDFGSRHISDLYP